MKKDSASVLHELGSRATLTGNTAKVRVLLELHARLQQATRTLKILDIGIVGPRPLEFWDPLHNLQGQFELTGVDVAGLERAERAARERGWANVRLQQSSGYELEKRFPAGVFDIVVATQVLEHVASPVRFLRQVSRVLRQGGECFLTIDSAHYRSRYDRRYPVRLAKNLVKKLLAVAGREKHYDLPWTAEEIARASTQSGLSVADTAFYCLEPLKLLHNRFLPAEEKNRFMQQWFALEESMNAPEGAAQKARYLFMGLYMHTRKKD